MIQQLDLNGTWQLRWSDGQRGRTEYAQRDNTDSARYIDATVPGEVHLEAWKAGWIEDPYVGTNVLAARWVEEMIWSYRREFDVPLQAIQEGTRTWLHFESLDLVASIMLNGVAIGTHRNFFYPCRLDVTGKLRPGKNVLAVHLDSGLYDVADKQVEGYCQSNDQRLHKRHWLRKPQCQFGWDWSQRLINVGISGAVRLEWTTEPVRVDRLVPLATLSDDFKQGRLLTRLFVEGLGSQPVQGELRVELVEAGKQITTPVVIQPGLKPVEAVIEIDNPKLWWPVGYGSQNRYTVRVTLSVAGHVVSERVATVGFRHVRVNQDALVGAQHPPGSRRFNLEVNGLKIFCKGGNFVPADMIFARIDRARYDKLTDLALESNFNLLRVWGGGLYESDDFYELCDAKGILVWQEFIFACARYPATDINWLEDFRCEARHNIRRLASHPSLVIWCGNNEMEQAVWDWGYDKTGVTLSDYGLFHYIIPRILKEEDPTRYYQPSSPYSPDTLSPNADHVGDQHPWSIGFSDNDFRKYRAMISRFPNEGGILGPTALPTMLASLRKGDEYPASFSWQIHENSIDSWSEPSYPDQMLRNWLGKIPGKDMREMSIPEFTYWAGLVQGEGLREYIDNFRRRMFDTGSAIFWMYNDCWPATRSWTTVDYYLRRTPAFHPVRRAMAPLSVVVAIEGEEIVVFGVNDTLHEVHAELRYGIFNLAGGYPMDRVAKVTLVPNASTRLARFAAHEWKLRDASMPFATLSRDGQLLARNRTFEPLFADIRWPKTNVRVRLNSGCAEFTSDTFAWGVCLDLHGESPLADNFFDLYPGMTYSIPWQGPHAPHIERWANA